MPAFLKEDEMVQIHRRFTDDQVRVLFRAYCQGLMTRAAVEEVLKIKKTRFFALLREYRSDPDGFSIRYERATSSRLSSTVEAEIEHELLREKEIVEDKRLPISCYNYSALRDRLTKKGHRRIPQHNKRSGQEAGLLQTTQEAKST
jgi:hypothetical protein